MRTFLYDKHIDLSAKMTEFAGWEMPILYSGIVEEVAAVRTGAGAFDLSHMGEFMVSGSNALDLLQRVFTNDVSALTVGQAQYSLMCDETGGVLDDVVIYRLEPDKYMVVVNAANINADFAWVSSHNSLGAELVDASGETALVAIQGPKAAEILQPVCDTDLSGMPRYHVRRAKVLGAPCWVASTGYTGGPGYEIFCSPSDADAVWIGLLSRGAVPIGLGARDVLRIEAGYPLYGHELSRSATPVEARLMWVVKPEKGDFIGKEAILRVQEAGTEQTLVGIECIDRCVPRHGYEVVCADSTVGCVTSGTFSPTLQKGVAMAYVKRDCGREGTELFVRIRDRLCKSAIVKRPFYRP
ncbi:MAG: glycine cleavage system aminomethyltransferase GcvT [Armatimonadota bacterium]